METWLMWLGDVAFWVTGTWSLKIFTGCVGFDYKLDGRQLRKRFLTSSIKSILSKQKPSSERLGSILTRNVEMLDTLRALLASG